MPPRLSTPRPRWLAYLTSFLCFFTCIALSCYVYWGNVPLGNMDNTGVSRISGSSWLITVNETTRGGGTAGQGAGLTKYGFGVFGWCEWSDTPDSESGVGTCHGGGMWTIDEDAPKGDPVRDLDLPPMIATSLFGVSVLLLIPVIASFALFLVHAFTFRYMYPGQPPCSFSRDKEAGIFKTPKYTDKRISQVRAAVLIRNPWYGLSFWCLSFGASLPMIVFVVMGERAYKGDDRYHIAYGRGFWCTIAMIFVMLLGLLVVWYGGLCYNEECEEFEDKTDNNRKNVRPAPRHPY